MPSGSQHEIRHGQQHAVVVEVGAGVRSYTVAGEDVLDGYTERERCSGGRGQVLIPWPNRLRDGQYEFDGQHYQLPLTEPEAGNAIHGLVRWCNWTVAERDPARVVMEDLLHPQPGWPQSLHIRIEYALDDDGLSVSTTATNLGDAACPFGAGAHPYLTLGTDSVDSLTLQVPGRRYLESDERGIPIAAHEVTGTPLDYTAPRPIGSARLDHAFAELERDDDGLTRVRLASVDGARRATLWMDRAYRYVMVFTGDTLPEPRRRRGVAIEPMTCAPNALQSGEGLDRLGPGQSFRARWGISPRD